MQAGQPVQKKKGLRAIDARLRKAHHALVIDDEEPQQIMPQAPVIAINQPLIAPIGRESLKSKSDHSSQDTLDDIDSEVDIFSDILDEQNNETAEVNIQLCYPNVPK